MSDSRGSGRERQPEDRDEVLDAAEEVDRLERHSSPSDDDAGIHPTRRQDTGPPSPHDE